jgi:putative transcriptional regulator
MITHHPSAELQFDYSTGTLTEPLALAVANHVALCDQCSAHLATLNTPDQLMRDHVQPVEMGDQMADSGITAPTSAEIQSTPTATSFDAQTLEVIPEPLRRYLSHNLADIPWQQVSGGMEEFRLQVSTPGYRVSLVRLEPGCKLPTHTHTKEELTVILAGGYTDGAAQFERGDFSHLDSSITHNPVADPDAGCMALGVLSGPIELTGLMGTLLNPLLRF